MPRTIDALIAQIEEHRDVLDATAAEAERLGEAPDALVAVLRELRVPLVKAPVETGGDGLTLAEQMRYFAALSYHNATAGWVGFNHAGAASAAAARLAGGRLRRGVRYATTVPSSRPSARPPAVSGGPTTVSSSTAPGSSRVGACTPTGRWSSRWATRIPPGSAPS